MRMENLNNQKNEPITDLDGLLEITPEEEQTEETNPAETAAPEEGAAEETEQAEGAAEETGQIQEVPSEGISFTPQMGFAIALGIVLIAIVILLLGKNKKTTQVSENTDTETSAAVNEEKPAVQVAKVHEMGAREDQQDSFGITDTTDLDVVQKKGIFMVVADGMGGLANGGKVSSLAVRTCYDVFYGLPEFVSASDMLLEMAAQTNQQVNRFLTTEKKSGSTLLTAIVRNGYLHFLTIGDSRVYLYRNGGLIQLNREHIYKEELAVKAANGKMHVKMIGRDPQASSLTSYLGNGELPYLDRNQEGIRLVDKDRIILASDGVFGTLVAEQMEAALALPMEEVAESMRKMITEANRPYQDNFTALIYEYRE